METEEQQRAMRLKKCLHFNGTVNKSCKRGVVYNDVKDSSTSPFRYPCHSDGVDILCGFREYPTVEQLDREDKEFAVLLSNMLLVRKAITDTTHGKRNLQGNLNCPVCTTGKVHYSVAYNGHIHAQCSTDKCVNWIE